MNARQFVRQRARIEHQFRGRSKQQRRALEHLVREAGAVVIVMGGKVMGWRMTDGQIVCAKIRYRDQKHAEVEMMLMKSRNWNDHRIPRRAYPCPHCGGWHLTSQDRAA